MALRGVISPATWLFVQKLMKANNKTLEVSLLLTLCGGNPLLTSELPTQWASNEESISISSVVASSRFHDDVIKWKHFPCNWPFVRGIHWSPVNSPHKGWWHGALMFSLICVWINDWVNNREAGDLRCYHAHYDVIVMLKAFLWLFFLCLPLQRVLRIIHCSSNIFSWGYKCVETRHSSTLKQLGHSYQNLILFYHVVHCE